MDKKLRLLESYGTKAAEYLKEGLVQRVEFVGPTYQIEVTDKESGETVWPFLKFSKHENLQDAFCSCDQNDAQGGCVHLAAALARIYEASDKPLHVRFESSFWNQLGKILSEHIGYDYSFDQEDGVFRAAEEDGKRFIEITTKRKKDKDELYKLLYEREKETEENSLKFSNLSPEEIARWKEGRPSAELRYLLSVWFDLAHWWMGLEDQGERPKISFEEIDHLPLHVQINWPRHVVSLLFTKEDLIALIPTLSTVDTTLGIQERAAETIRAIRYDKTLCQLKIDKKQVSSRVKKHEAGITIDGWMYLSGVGFILEEEKSVFEKNIIPKEEIGEILETKREIVETYLEGDKIHRDPVPLKYKMYFDADWNWHFEGYLFKEGDLKAKEAVFFGSWAYLPEAGFYPIAFSLFKTGEGKISPYLVSSFVDEHRVWLNSQEGFGAHLAGIEAQMSYQVNEDGSLEFKTTRLGGEKIFESRDFGQWIYTPEEGFFSKSHSRLGLTIRPGLKILANDVSDFIKTHRDELETISHFFGRESPLKNRGLSLKVIDDNTLEITPVAKLHSSYARQKALFFDDFVYLEALGFCELSFQMRLPKRYTKKVIIEGEYLHYFLRSELDGLMPQIIQLDPRLKRPHKIDFEVNYLARSPKGGLRAKILVRTELGSVDLVTLKEGIEQKKRFLFSEAGLIDLNSEVLAWLKTTKANFDVSTRIIDIPTMEFLRLDVAFGFFVPEEKTSEVDIIQRLLDELRNFVTHRSFELKGLKSILRPYQQTGVSWLWFLYQNDLAGILCDEMGLGKTHQAMALVAAISNQKEKKNSKYLVVCPTSVIYHWQDKLHRFLPKIKVHLFHGTKRSLKRLPKEGIILTSYGICRTENKRLQKIPFELAIFDELQIAKNPHSQVHEALGKIEAKMRLGLTGTPIENNLRELKSLFDLVLPGYMPQESAFRELFINPIEREKDEEKIALLRQLIKPFMLRRKKKEVLAELPEKTEEKAVCLLSHDQAELYQKILQESGQTLLSDLKEKKTPVSYVHIFAVLSKLKQVCNHPALILKEPKHYTRYKSGKWELFVELLRETRESGQKVVVFSQFLMMLDIIELYVKEQGWGYAQIRGDTLDRKEQIDRFQTDPDCHVFIGSLGAAGLGIDLTAASTVILYDRWWNAARENQAIDRVHRIGQKWAVQVFKLITKGTIEEKIDKMVMRKSKLMEEIVTADDQDEIKKFTRQELIELLSFLPESEEGWETSD